MPGAAGYAVAPAVYPLVARGTQPVGARDDVPLDLVGAGVDRRSDAQPQVAFHVELERVAVAAHELDSLEGHLLRRLGDLDLGHRGRADQLLGRAQTVRDPERRVVGQ